MTNSNAREITREISYAHSAQTRLGRSFIRTVENMTGRLGLIKRAQGYEQEVQSGRDFWEVMVERYRIGLNIVRGSLETIPSDGPLIVISNHPYGILDGLVLGHILSLTRPDFRIIAHQVFRKAEDLNRVILPIDFSGTKAAQKINIETRAQAMTYLSEGGCIGIFPGGTVSTALKPFDYPLDPAWRSFTAKMIMKSDAKIVPLYFDGHNSRLFQIASHAHYTLRMALLINEFRTRVDDEVQLVIGDPIERAEMAPYLGNARELMDYLRQRTYSLSPKPLKTMDYGYEFESGR